MPRARRLAPTAMILAAVLTAGSGASAVSMRLNSDNHKATQAAGTTGSLAPTQLALPVAPEPAALPPGTTEQPHASTAIAQVPRPHRLIEATLLVTSAKPLS